MFYKKRKILLRQYLISNNEILHNLLPDVETNQISSEKDENNKNSIIIHNNKTKEDRLKEYFNKFQKKKNKNSKIKECTLLFKFIEYLINNFIYK